MSYQLLKPRAEALKSKAGEIKPAALLMNPAAAVEVVEELADLLIETCERLDALTPYQDELNA